MEYVLLYVWMQGHSLKYTETAPDKDLYTHEQCIARAAASRAQGIKDLQCVKIERDSD